MNKPDELITSDNPISLFPQLRFIIILGTTFSLSISFGLFSEYGLIFFTLFSLPQHVILIAPVLPPIIFVIAIMSQFIVTSQRAKDYKKAANESLNNTSNGEKQAKDTFKRQMLKEAALALSFLTFMIFSENSVSSTIFFCWATAVIIKDKWESFLSKQPVEITQNLTNILLAVWLSSVLIIFSSGYARSKINQPLSEDDMLCFKNNKCIHTNILFAIGDGDLTIDENYISYVNLTTETKIRRERPQKQSLAETIYDWFRD